MDQGLAVSHEFSLDPTTDDPRHAGRVRVARIVSLLVGIAMIVTAGIQVGYYDLLDASSAYTRRGVAAAAWLNGVMGVGALVFTWFTRPAAGGRLLRAWVLGGTIASGIILETHSYLGGSLSTWIPMIQLTLVLWCSRLLPWRQTLGLVVAGTLLHGGVVALQVAELLPYAPILVDASDFEVAHLEGAGLWVGAVMLVFTIAIAMVSVVEAEVESDADQARIARVVAQRTQSLSERSGELRRHEQRLAIAEGQRDSARRQARTLAAAAASLVDGTAEPQSLLWQDVWEAVVGEGGPPLEGSADIVVHTDPAWAFRVARVLSSAAAVRIAPQDGGWTIAGTFDDALPGGLVPGPGLEVGDSWVRVWLPGDAQT